MFSRFMTSKTGIFLKKPLVHELAEAIDGSASTLESNLFRSVPQLPQLPGMNGPVDGRRMAEIQIVLETFQEALIVEGRDSGRDRLDAIIEVFRGAIGFLSDPRMREEAGPLLEELQSVIRMVAVEVLEIRGSRAIEAVLRV